MEAWTIYSIIFLVGLVIGLLYALSFIARMFSMGGGVMPYPGGYRNDGGMTGMLMLLSLIAFGAIAYIAYERYDGDAAQTAEVPQTEWEEFLHRYDGEAEEEPESEFELEHDYEPEGTSPGQLERDWQERLWKAHQQGRMASGQNAYDDYTEQGEGDWPDETERPLPTPPKPYYIQLASSSNQQAALEEAAKAAARYQADTWLGIGDTRYAQAYKVLLGPFATADEAKATQKRLKTGGFVKNALEEELKIQTLQKK